MLMVAVSSLYFQAAMETIAFVQSLLDAEASAEGRFKLQIHVADNASDTADRQQLWDGLDSLPAVHVHLHDVNLGFAAGHNRNLDAIFAQSRPDYVWLLNNDCVIDPECITALLQCARSHPDVGIWGATLLETDGRTIQCAGGCFYSTWLSTYRQFAHGKNRSSSHGLKNHRFDYIAGASLFMPVSTLIDGLEPARHHPADRPPGSGEWLNKTFFLYFEELDLARRLRNGLQMGWCKDAMIVHARNVRTSPGAGKHSAKTEYHSSLSALKFTWLYHHKLLWIMAPARLLAKFLQHFFSLRWDLLSPTLRAYGDFRSWVKHGEHPVRTF